MARSPTSTKKEALAVAVSFSVVIPTRNRPTTLAKALATCVTSDYPDLEVLVCDNSDPEVRDAVTRVVAGAGDPRVKRIVNPGSPCSMSRNWSYAVSSARGDYVTVIGDDDGFLDFGFRIADQVLTRTGADVLSWPASSYRWPDCPEVNRRNTVVICHGKTAGHCQWNMQNGRELIQYVLDHPTHYYSLPMLYNAFFHRSAIDRMRGNAEDFLLGQSPDIFSGVAGAIFARKLVRLDASLSLQGLSGYSNGLAAMVANGDNGLQADFRALNAKDGRGDTRGVVNISVCAAQVADSFNRLRELYPQECAGLQLTRQSLARNQALEICERSYSREVTLRQLHELVDYYGKEPAAQREVQRLLEWFEKSPPKTEASGDGVVYGFGEREAVLSGEPFGLRDIADASRLVSRLLNITSASEAPHASLVRRAITRSLPPIVIDGLRHMRRQFARSGRV